mmetsp:Transcript_8066/g.14357  ORF Transcript_8066/g.14357 Transcript_8066/m.14357 type:complete len:230 (+) Transcript_8066:1144-1833(+)
MLRMLFLRGVQLFVRLLLGLCLRPTGLLRRRKSGCRMPVPFLLGVQLVEPGQVTLRGEGRHDCQWLGGPLQELRADVLHDVSLLERTDHGLPPPLAGVQEDDYRRIARSARPLGEGLLLRDVHPPEMWPGEALLRLLPNLPQRPQVLLVAPVVRVEEGDEGDAHLVQHQLLPQLWGVHAHSGVQLEELLLPLRFLGLCPVPCADFLLQLLQTLRTDGMHLQEFAEGGEL